MNLGSVRKIIREVFDYYESQANLEFLETSDPKAIIQISFESRDYHPPCTYRFESEAILAHAFQPLDPSYSIGSDLHFYDIHRWNRSYTSISERKLLSKRSSIGLESVLDPSLYSVGMHEIGHALGLAHNPNSKSVMFAIDLPRNGKEEIRLDSQDLWTLNSIYGGKQQKYIPHPAAPLWTTPSPPTTTSFIRHRNKGHVHTHEDPIKPRACSSSADAIFTVHEDFYVFKANWYWRVHNKTYSIDGPHPISERFHGLPTPVDAAIQIQKNTYFFVGDKYYIYQYPSRRQLYGASRIDSHLKVQHIDKVVLAFNYFDPTFHDAKRRIFLWTKGGDEYHYWLLKPPHRNGALEAEPTYPRKRSTVWSQIPFHSDAAFTKGDDVYFVEGASVYRLNGSDPRNGIAEGYPLPLGALWEACRKDYVLDKRRTNFSASSLPLFSSLFTFLFLFSISFY